MGKKDVRDVINHYQIRTERNELSEKNLIEVKKTFKKLFKWMEKEEAVSWFTSSGWENRLSLSDLITESEFEARIAVCMNSKNMALLSLLYESGTRIGKIGCWITWEPYYHQIL